MKSRLYIGALLTIAVLGAALTAEVYAQGGGSTINAKVRAIQDDKVLGTGPGEEGVVGANIDCVGGVDSTTANDFHCFLVPEGIGIGTINWPSLIGGGSLPSGVKMLSSTTPMSCDGLPGGLDTNNTCFSVTFPASDFTVGEWHFVAVFTENGNVIDLAGIDYKVNSFMVIPELFIGSIGLAGSMLGTFYLYRRRSVKEE
ncbi:hypothetical protein HRbin04_00983 [archaeon HR04]|nr:hypothetical protein HRbin04_00983 [archaeon HR04]